MTNSYALVGPLPPPLGGATVLFSEIEHALRGSGATVEVINTSGENQSLIRRAIRVVRCLWRMKRAELVLVGGSWPSVLPLTLVTSLRTWHWRVPLVVRLFGGDYRTRLSRSVIQKLARLALGRADVVEVESADCVATWKVVLPRTDVRSAPNIRHVPSSTPRTAPRRPPVVGFAGRLCEAKGVDILCRVAQSRGEEWCFVAVGPEQEVAGPWPARLKESGVEYKGELDPSDMAEWFDSIDVLVVPTTTWPEGHPGVIIESLRAGVPVVATDVGGICDLVDQNVGQLVLPNDPLLIELAIATVFDSISTYRRLSANCVALSHKFSAELWVESLKESFNPRGIN